METIIYLFTLAVMHAIWETEIEGKDGWAKNLPTWRISSPYKKVFNGKDITGYHVFMIIIFGMFFHSYFLYNPWSHGKELICIGSMFFYLVVEDFLWFVFNPYYETKKFFQQKVRWHKRWLLGLPYDYWYMILIGSCLTIVGRIIK